MLDFIKEKARELGAQNCPHCEQLDFGFGLAGKEPGGGKCINCTKDVQKYNTLKTMQFSFEIFRELVANYDDFHLSDDKQAFRGNMITSINNFLDPIINEGVLPPDDDMLRLQVALKTMQVAIGSEKQLGGVITMKMGALGMALGKPHYKNTVKILAVCILSINYILTYPAKASPLNPKPAKQEKKGLFSRWFS